MSPTIYSTLSLTTTLFVALATATSQSPSDIPIAISALSSCAQNILFPLLGNSQCNPSDFACVCTELDRVDAAKSLSDGCPDDAASYAAFVSATCGASSSSSIPPSTTGAPVVLTTGAPANLTASPTGPFTNATFTIHPTETKTAVIVLPSAPANGSLPVAPGVPAQPAPPADTGKPAAPDSSSSPTSPEFAGEAAPSFSGVGAASFAGFMGLMWLAFAEL